MLFCPRRLVKKNGVIYPSLALATMSPGERSRFLLLHAGEGGERPEMERIVGENHLEENVRLLGGQGPDTIRQLYRLCDIVLVPSVHSENVEEATSLSALEAMASGRPLIAGAVGGLAEMVVDGENGLLVPADAEALAAAILRLAAAPELGARLAAAAREYVVEKHSHLRAAAAYVEVYRRTVEATRPAPPRPAPTFSPATTPVATRRPRRPADRRPAGQVAFAAWPSISVLGFPLDVVSLEAGGPLGDRRRRRADRGGTHPHSPRRLVQPRARRPRPARSGRGRGDVGRRSVLSRRGRRGLGGETAGGAGLGAAGERPRAVERVPGIDLAQRILELAAEQGLSVYFLGAAEGVAAEAARVQGERLPGLRVVGTHMATSPTRRRPA